MKLKEISQLEFSSVLFDTLFGLIIFFGLDSFLEVKTLSHLFFYILATVIVVHWWLYFKSADDTFGEEVTDSAVDLVFGIIYIIIIDYIILLAKDFNYQAAIGFLVALYVVDMIWSLAWLYIGQWRTKDPEKIKLMETELKNSAVTDIMGIVFFGFLFIIGSTIPASSFVFLAIFLYLIYIIISFKKQLVSLAIF